MVLIQFDCSFTEIFLEFHIRKYVDIKDNSILREFSDLEKHGILN